MGRAVVVRRASAVLTGLDAFRERVRAEMMVLKKTPADRLRFGTIIISAHRVKLTDNPVALVEAEIAKFKADFRSCLIGHLTRGVRVAGVFEIDLVTPKLLTSGKRALLRDVDVEEIAADEQVIIVHIHMLIDCRGYSSPEALGRDLRRQFPGPRRIVLEELHADKSVSENIENLAGYFSKHIRAYSNAFDDGGRRVKFSVNFDREWAVWLDRLYENISIDNTLYSTTSSRAGDQVECKVGEPNGLTKTPAPQGFLAILTTDKAPDQLRHREEDSGPLSNHFKEIAEQTYETVHQHTNHIIRQRSQVIAEQCSTPFDDKKPMVFYLMKRIMQKTIGPSLPIANLTQTSDEMRQHRLA